MVVASAPTDVLFEERYRAISARDTRFDGQFFTAVTSTGIYCRPSCPARTPKPGNVRFFLTAAAAHEAGFRACKRCLPDSTPESPQWNVRRDVTGRAMRLIADGVVDREGVEGLATRLGYTSRHIHRLLTTELGAGPQALARAHRAQSARLLLVSTSLSMSDVAFASGFGSVRQFNETIAAVYGLSPRQLRATALRARPVTRGAATRIYLDISLPVRRPFDARGIVEFLAARAVPGVESFSVDDDARLRYARTLHLPGGPGAFEILANAVTEELTARLELSSLSDVVPAVSRIRRLFDLDADPIAIDEALASHPSRAASVWATPGIRLPGAVDPEEMVVRALVGQQISVRAATSHLGRLAERLGSDYESSIEGLTRLFPTSRQVAEGLPEPDSSNKDRPLRLPAQSIDAIRSICRKMASGELEIHTGVAPETLRERLLDQPRIGPWSASYIAMRVLGDPDMWLIGDVALLAGAKRLGLLPKEIPTRAGHRVLAGTAAEWAPWRSYAALHLWSVV